MRLFAVLLLAVLLPFFLWEREIADIASRWLAVDVPLPLVWAAVVVLLALDVLLPVPSSIVSVAAGSLLGFQLGFVANWLGMMAGCCLGYAAGRAAEPWARRQLIRSRDWPVLQQRVQKHAVVAIMLSRPVPVLAEMVVLTAGVLKLPWRRLIGIAVVGNAVIAAIYAGVGALGFSRDRLIAAFAVTVLGSWLAQLLFNRWLRNSGSGVPAILLALPLCSLGQNGNPEPSPTIVAKIEVVTVTAVPTPLTQRRRVCL